MEEGKLYILQNVSVTRNGAEFRLANHEYKLEVTRFSVVTSMLSESLRTIHWTRTKGNQQPFQNPLADITGTQSNNNDIPNRRSKTINNICTLRNNLLNEFVVASSTSTTHKHNEIHGHSIVPEQTNDSLHQTHEDCPNESTENTSYYQWLGNLKNLLSCISMIQKMKLKIELVEQEY
ncbi:hypothetical protein JHK86_035085 [Glycine max]|nr:hypothetical protein JHK86_035085 [Glycine max]